MGLLVSRCTGVAFALVFLISQVHASDGCDLINGEKVFGKCAVCHSMAAGDVHQIGPNLNGVIDRAVGQVEGFKFSRSLRESDQTWTTGHLDTFLSDPMGVYQRTRMAFSGLKKSKDRDDVVCFIREASKDGTP